MDWDDVSAIVLDCLADDPITRRAALEKIPAADWAALDAALAHRDLQSPPGLYPV